MYLDLIKGYRVTIGGTMPLLKNIERTLMQSVCLLLMSNIAGSDIDVLVR